MTIYDPLNTVNGVPQPFPGNRIPANRIDPVARNLLSYMVAPNTTPDAHAEQLLRGEQLALRHLHVRASLRVDHNFGANHRFFARYGHNGRRETRAKSGREEEALTAGYHHRWNNVLSVDLTSTIGPTLLSSARVGWTRHRRLDISGAEDMGGFDMASLGFPATLHQRAAAAVPADPGQRLRAAPSIGQGGGQDGPSDDFYVSGSR